MSYILKTSSGGTITVAKGGVNRTDTSLSLIGENYAGYGQLENENWIRLLENFANNVPPINPIVGQIWFDTSDLRFKYFYDGNDYTTIGVAVGTTAPDVTPREGDLWWNPADGFLKLYSTATNDYIDIGPFIPSESVATAAETRTVAEQGGGNRSVVVIVDDTVPGTGVSGIISSHPDFTISTTNPLSADFTQPIKPGYNPNPTIGGFLFNGNAASATTATTATTATNLSRSIVAGNGLTGGGILNNDRTLSVDANDGILVDSNGVSVDTSVVRTTRTISAGSGLNGGGDLTADRTLSVAGGDGISVGAEVNVDTTVVRTTVVNQTISGVKTFSNTIQGSISGNAATADAVNNQRTVGTIQFWSGTQAQYDEIGSGNYVSNILYIITTGT
jgi:hypothetical protein